MKGDPSREVVLLSNDLNMMLHKHLMAAAWEANWSPASHAPGRQHIRDFSRRLPTACCATWKPWEPHLPPVRLGEQELHSRVYREEAEDLRGRRFVSQILSW